MGLLDELLLRVQTAQRNTPGGDQMNRPSINWDQALGIDPGVYGMGHRGVGNEVVQPPTVQWWPGYRELGNAQRVRRDLEGGLDTNLTGSGLEMTAEDYRRSQGSAIDRLLEFLRQPRPAAQFYENMR